MLVNNNLVSKTVIVMSFQQINNFYLLILGNLHLSITTHYLLICKS